MRGNNDPRHEGGGVCIQNQNGGLGVLPERAHDSLNEVRQMDLSYAQKAYQVPLFATKIVLFIVAIYELFVGYLGKNGRYSHRKKVFLHLF